MSKLLSRYYALAAMMKAVVEEKSIKPQPYVPFQHEPNTIDEQLVAKGLQEFEINGVKIIAHNEREAMKRYKHRSKQ